MKMHSKLMNSSTALCASVLMLLATNASASNDGVELPSANDPIIENELSYTPPSTLQIVSLTPFEYNGGVHIRCNGQSSGRATVVVSGGVAPYTYQWSGLPSQTGATALGMSAGNYTVTVTDALGNSVSQSVTLIENPPLQAVANVSPILCNGGVATITMSAVGGTPPYAGLNWYQAVSGVHPYTVADANGCRSRIYQEITEPPALIATSIASPILCNGDMSNVVVEATGGVAPYYGTGSFSEPAGTASYNLIDANGCYAYTSVTISEPPALEVDLSNSEIKCRGGVSDITVSGFGGVGPYYGEGTFPQMPAGNYTYMITDANGCQSSSSISVTQPSALVATISNTSIACHGDFSAVDVTASGGVAPYAGPGTYYVQSGLHQYNVTDANGCSVDISTMITEPSEVEMYATWNLVQGSNSAMIDIQATGGTPSYSGVGLFPAMPGNYTLSVTDANGCEATESIIIPVANTNPSLINTVITNNANVANVSQGENQSTVEASFNVETKQAEILYSLQYDSNVSIEVYDITGALVETIEEGTANQGLENRCLIDSAKFTNGTYVIHVVTNKERITDKVLFIQ